MKDQRRDHSTLIKIPLHSRFDEDANHVELDYPRDMSMWKGIGYNINSAFQNRDGKTYFFKGKGYWRFDDLRMSVTHLDPHPSAERWMKCKQEPKQKEPIIHITTEDQREVIISGTDGSGRRWNVGNALVLGAVVLVSLKITIMRIH